MAPKVVIVWNVYVSSEYRINRLIDAINSFLINGLIDHSLRIRGPLTQDALFFLREAGVFDSAKINLYTSQQSKNWKINTLVQVLESDAKILLLTQEDHICVGDQEAIADFVNSFSDLGSEVSPVSFFRTYQKMRASLVLTPGFTIKSKGLFKRMEVDWAQSIDNPRYLVSLVGLYKREVLIKLLLRKSYGLRQFPPNTPFDFEQGPKKLWFLPILFALPLFEFLTCIDDDAKVPGSSLHSKNLYPIDSKRTNEQNIAHNRIDLLTWIKKVISKFNLDQSTIAKIMIRGIFLGERVKYTSVQCFYNRLPLEIGIRRKLLRKISTEENL